MKLNLNWNARLALTVLLMLGFVFGLSANSISGTIVNETDQAVGNAYVQLMRLAPNGPNGEMLYRTTHTDPAGLYSFNDIQEGNYHVSAIAPQYIRSYYVSPEGEILVVEVDADDQEVIGIDIQLIPQNGPPPPHDQTGVTGRVLNSSNQPIPHVRVGIVNTVDLNTPLPNLTSLTNMNGFYLLHDVLPGQYQSCVLNQNLQPVAYSAVFTIVEDVMLEDIDIVFDPPPPPELGSISGNVIGYDHHDNMMDDVRLVTPDAPQTVLPGLIGHVGWSGFYMIHNIPVGSYMACLVDEDDVPVAYSALVTVIADEMIENVDIVTDSTYVGYSLSGSLQDAQGQPITQGVVELRSAQNDLPPNNPNHHHMHLTVHPDSLGNYSFANVQAGEYIVSLWTPMSPVVFYPSTLDIELAVPVAVVDQNVSGINITVPAVQNWTISGYVLDADTAAPLAGIKVKTDRMGFHHFPMHDHMFHDEFHALTDANGFYSFTAPEGNYTLAAVDTTHFYRIQFFDHANMPFQATVLELNQDYNNINFDLIPRQDSLHCSISGSITENGEPVTYPVMVVAVSSDEDWEDSIVSENGSYSINHMRPGDYYIMAYSLYSPPVYYNNVLTPEDASLIAVNGPVTGIDFALVSTDADGPSNLNGVITDNSNNALSNVIVMLANAQNEIVGFARTDASGAYSIANVPTDSYTVVVSRIGYTSVTQDIYLEGSSNLNVTINQTTANDDQVVPVVVASLSNYPNPFNPHTTISLSLTKDSPVTVKVYNVKGQCIRTLLQGDVKAGNQELVWNGTDQQGRAVTSGIYIVRMEGNGFSQSLKMTLMK